jgi:myo-inositol-1(or 4)-monophosphatase
MDDATALEIATRAAREGGKTAMARLGDAGYLKWKGHRDVVPEAALAVQEQIVSILQRECPGDAVLAEEGPEDEPLDVTAERLWIVDPICGSLNYAQSIPFWAVSIALRVRGTLRLGVVYEPMRDEMFAARLGEPATCNGRPIAVLTVAMGPEFWEQAWVACDLAHSGPRRRLALRAFDLISNEVLHHLVLGSPALGLCYVAAGRLHAYWTMDAKPWDVAAAGVILGQAGGLITDGEGGSWLHSDGGYVGANAVSHKWALQTVKGVLEQQRTREPERSGA